MTPLGELPRAGLVRSPTPLRLLGEGAGGRPLLVKRDDLCVAAFGGCKARALDVALGVALDAGADVVLTSGTAGSNHVAATAVLGRALGLDTRALVLPQAGGRLARRNAALGRRAGAEIVPVPVGTSLRVDGAALRTQLDALRVGGRRPYLLPFGSCGHWGRVAHARAAAELAGQVSDAGMHPPAAVYLAAATMTTAAGVLVGLRAGGLSSRVVAVQVAGDVDAGPRTLFEQADELAAALGVRPPRPWPGDVEVRDGRPDAGFGTPTAPPSDPGVGAALPTDEIYTAPAAATFLRDAADPGGGPGSLLFWHTGSILAGDREDGGGHRDDAVGELDAV